MCWRWAPRSLTICLLRLLWVQAEEHGRGFVDALDQSALLHRFEHRGGCAGGLAQGLFLDRGVVLLQVAQDGLLLGRALEVALLARQV